jgi:hypothetical protein
MRKVNLSLKLFFITSNANNRLEFHNKIYIYIDINHLKNVQVSSFQVKGGIFVSQYRSIYDNVNAINVSI